MVGAVLFASALPAGFIPEEDQGLFGVNVQLRPGRRSSGTAGVLTLVEEIIAKTPGVDASTTIGGYGVVTSTYQPNFGTVFVRLKPWDERHGRSFTSSGSWRASGAQFAQIPEAIIFPFNIPRSRGSAPRPDSRCCSRTGAAR